MAARVSESIVLRTYPLREADLIVSFFTREDGKLRGVARAARKPKNQFGAGLERLSVIRMHYSHRENRELLTLISCELLQSPFELMSQYGCSVALDFMAEVADKLLPAGEPSERFFRLMLVCFNHLQRFGEHGTYAAATYFAFWAVRLNGFLPEMRLREDSAEIATEFSQFALEDVPERSWSRDTASDLRRQLVRQIEEQLEQRLISAPLLETL